MRESAERDFKDHGRPIVMVTGFKYLGPILISLDNNWSEVVGNLQKARKFWARMKRILGRYGASPRVSGMSFKAVVQVVLLFGLETWVMTPPMGRDLGGFQHRFSRRIIGRQPQRKVDGSW